MPIFKVLPLFNGNIVNENPGYMIVFISKDF